MEHIVGSSDVITQTAETPVISSASANNINEEKAPDSSENAQKPKVLKAKKRKKPKDSTAPRVPLTGNTSKNNEKLFFNIILIRLYEISKRQERGVKNCQP